MSAPRIYAHLGLPKTASTYLQRSVFPALGNLHFVKKHDFRHHAAILAQPPAEHLLFSFEFLIGKPSANANIRRFAEAAPDAQPLLFLRRHDRWLASRYKYYLRKHGTRPFSAFVDPAGQEERLFPPAWLDYGAKIRFLEEVFGRPPLVFFQEELQTDAQATVEALARALGATAPPSVSQAPVKTAYSPRQLLWVRRFNRRVPFQSLPPSTPKLVKLVRQKPVELALHTTALLGGSLPERWVAREAPLIPADELAAIRDCWAADWAHCLHYAAAQRPLLIELPAAPVPEDG